MANSIMAKYTPFQPPEFSFDVSVVIVSWNTLNLLKQTLETLYRETRGVNFETIVVDNGSTDGSASLDSKVWDHFRLLALGENKGFAFANNAGFKRTRGRYILLLNSDTIVLPSTLPGMSRYLDNHPDAGCVGCRHLSPSGELQGSIDSFPSLLKDFLCCSELRRLPVLQPFLRRHYPWWGDHDRICEVDWVNGSCLMVRREVIEQVGGMDESFFLYAEEIDWCYRMKSAGWPIYFTPESEVVHIGGQSTKRISEKRIMLLYQGQYRFYRKHYPIWKYAILRLMVGITAFFRLGFLFFLYFFPSLSVKIGSYYWEVLTQEAEPIELPLIMRTWWKIIFLPWKL